MTGLPKTREYFKFVTDICFLMVKKKKNKKEIRLAMACSQKFSYFSV